MSDIPLPLWNREETDVLPQYRLSYGHALVAARLTRAAVEGMAKQLGLGRLAYEGPVDYPRLPKDESGEYRTFGTPEQAHLLVADLDGCQAVFAPHRLFFNNRAWIRWNKHAGGLMAIVARDDLRARSYHVFRAGNLEANAWAEGRTLRFPEQPEIEVYLNQELLYRS